jgi:hypothetical protein
MTVTRDHVAAAAGVLDSRGMPVDADRRAVGDEGKRAIAGTERRFDPKPVEVPGSI